MIIATDMELLVDGRPVRGSYNVEQEWLDVTTEFEPDPSWWHVDGHGHVHRWMVEGDPSTPLTDPSRERWELSTLVQVNDPEPHWCELCRGGYQPQHDECRTCGDTVEPRSRRTAGRRYIPGMEHVEFGVEEVLPLGDVTVTVPGDPRRVFPARVVSHEVRLGVDGWWGSLHIVPTGPPTEVDG